MFDTEQIALIRASWAEAVTDPSTTSRLFYGRLFQEHPHLRALFGEDMVGQGRKLMDTINFVVDHLEEPDALEEPVKDLGVRHLGYGVSSDDYAPVGGALIWTFRHLLGDGFTDEMEAAWTDVYGHLAQLMTGAKG